MKTIDNKDTFLSEDLVRTLRKGSHVYVMADCFSLFFFEALRHQLKHCAALDFLFMDKVNIVEEEEAPLGITHPRSLLSRRQLIIRCVRWIQKKARFKVNPTLKGQEGSIWILNRQGLVEYTDPAGFTVRTLGWPPTDPATARVLQTVLDETEGPADTEILRQKLPGDKQLLRHFHNLWTDTDRTKDVTDEVVDRIMKLW